MKKIVLKQPHPFIYILFMAGFRLPLQQKLWGSQNLKCFIIGPFILKSLLNPALNKFMKYAHTGCFNVFF